MKVYLCGSKDHPQAFAEAEALLKKQGHIPINPVSMLTALPEELNNSDFTVIAFELIRISDTVYPLNGWHEDLPARMEMAHARRLEKDIYDKSP